MKENKISFFGRLFLASGAVYLFLKYLSPVLAPAFAAVLFVTIFGPCLLKWQRKYKLSRQFGAIILLFLLLIILCGLGWVFGSYVVSNLPGWMDSIYDVRLPDKLEAMISQVEEKVLPGLLTQSLLYAGNCVKLFAFLVCFCIVTVLLAKDYDAVMNYLLEREDCRVILEVLCGVVRYLASFLRTQAVIMTLIGLLCSVVLCSIGISGGIFWGVAAGILDALPFIGTGVVLFPTAVLEFFSGHYFHVAVCAVLYVACILIREILEPKLIGGKVGLPPAIVLLAVYAGVKLFGPWGIIEGPLGFVVIRQIMVSTQSACKSTENVV